MKRRWISILAVLTLFVLAYPANFVHAAPDIPTMCMWNGGSTGAWTTGTNWIYCNGTDGVPGSAEIVNLVDGASITITDVPTTTIYGLSVWNNTTANLQAGPAANTLTISSSLDVAGGSALNMNGANALTIFLGAGAIGSIAGNMTCSTAVSRLNAQDANAITFSSGATFTQATGCTGNVFTSSGTANAVVFASGSKFVSQAGSNPFGMSAPNSKVVFQSGSLFRHEQTGLPALSGRTYADFELNSANTFAVSTGTNTWTVDNLTITQGTMNVTAVLAGYAQRAI